MTTISCSAGFGGMYVGSYIFPYLFTFIFFLYLPIYVRKILHLIHVNRMFIKEDGIACFFGSVGCRIAFICPTRWYMIFIKIDGSA